jgi:hypothetical protein
MVAAICLVLAGKVNDPKDEGREKRLREVLLQANELEY